MKQLPPRLRSQFTARSRDATCAARTHLRTHANLVSSHTPMHSCTQLLQLLNLDRLG